MRTDHYAIRRNIINAIGNTDAPLLKLRNDTRIMDKGPQRADRPALFGSIERHVKRTLNAVTGSCVGGFHYFQASHGSTPCQRNRAVWQDRTPE